VTVSQETQVMEIKHLRFHAGAAAVTIAHLADPKAAAASFDHYKYMFNHALYTRPLLAPGCS